MKTKHAIRLAVLAPVAACVVAALSTATADAATRPSFVSGTASFEQPNITVSFKEKGLGRSHPVRYELHGNRRTVYECGDGSNSIEINGPILDQSTGFPFGSTPVTKTYTSDKHGIVSGTLSGQPFPALQFNGVWGPLTCSDGSTPVMTADQFYGTTDEPLSVLDQTHSIRLTFTGIYGFCNSTAYRCVS
jgi:hypothetical protein